MSAYSHPPADRPEAAGAPSAAARYQALEAARRPYLDRAREAARLTTPALAPPEGHDGGRALPTPYQGVGARGVNALASKLLLAQFPPGGPFFRLAVDPLALEAETAPPASGDAAAGPDPDPDRRARLVAAVNGALAKIERSVLAEMEAGFLRAALHSCLKQLIVAGNCLLHLTPEGGARVFRLDRYVVKRDPMGAVIEILVKERVSAALLPETAAPEILRRAHARPVGAGDREVDLYTWIRREKDHWSVAQEAAGVEIPESRGAYPLDRLDWLALRWSHEAGEDYGRGHVEEHLGDLRSLEGLMQAVVEGSAAAARMTVLVAPNGQTDAEELAEAENGAIIDGVASDVTILQAGKLNDFRVTFEAIEMLTERLSFAFLLGGSAKRDAVHVTAEEIRFLAGELEDALGGVYSVLAEELQKPLVALLIRRKARDGLLPPLPPGLLRPEIVTGLDALGRGRTLQRLEAFIAFVGKIGALSATPMGERLDLPKMLVEGAAAIGVAAEDLVKPAEAGPPLAGGAPLTGEAGLAGLVEALGGASEVDALGGAAPGSGAPGTGAALSALAERLVPAIQAALEGASSRD